MTVTRLQLVPQIKSTKELHALMQQNRPVGFRWRGF